MNELVAPLFSPFSARSLTIANRTVMAPMGRMFAQNHIPHPDAAAYYRRRAEGGVGLLITEATGIDHPLAPDHGGTPVMHGEQALAAWKVIVDEVHRVGGKIIPQFFHQGMLRGGGAADGTMASMRPSGIIGEAGSNSFAPEFIEAAKKPTPAMTESDIQDMIDGFTRSAKNAQELGFDGVELHGAHGYIIDSGYPEFLVDKMPKM